MTDAAPETLPDDEDLLTIADIEARTKKHRTTIRRWIEKGLFPAGRMTGPQSRQWTRREYREWLDGCSTAQST
jgi:predicted DNA-binding transcriptional regulator AlpA